MPSVLHLALVDLRRVRWAAASWIAVYLSVPLGMEQLAHTPLPAIDDRFRAFGGAAPWLPVVSVFVEPLLAWLVAALVVQSDPPRDDRAFWRTRPIAPSMLVAGKATALAALLVGLPIVVTVVRFATYAVPPISLLTIAIQMVIGRASWIAAGFLLAALTGTLARLVLLLLGLGAVLMATFSVVVPLVAGGGGVGSVSVGFLGIGAPADGYASFTIVLVLMALGALALYAWRSRVTAVACLAAGLIGPALIPAAHPGAGVVRLEDRIRDHVQTVRPMAIGLMPQQPPPGTMPDAPLQVVAHVPMADLPIRFTADLPELDATLRTTDGATFRGKGRTIAPMYELPSRGVAAGLDPCAASRVGSPVCRRGLQLTLVDLQESARRRLAGAALGVEVRGALHVAEHRAVAVLPLRSGVAIRRPAYLLEVLQVEQRPTGVGLAGRFTRFPALGSAVVPQIALFVRRGPIGAQLALIPRSLPGSLTLHGAAHRHVSERTWGAAIQELFFGLHGLEQQPYPVTAPTDWSKDVELVVVESTYVGSTEVRWTATDMRVGGVGGS